MKMLHLIKSACCTALLGVLLPMTGIAQQLSPVVVGSAGTLLQAVSSGANLSFTTGEALIQTLSTANEVALGQGFHNAAFDGIVKTGEVIPDVDILLYPNPASESLYATLSAADQAPLQLHASVFDAMGRQVVAGLSFPASGRYTIPVHYLPDGIYALQFTNAQGQSNTFHFIKIR